METGMGRVATCCFSPTTPPTSSHQGAQIGIIKAVCGRLGGCRGREGAGARGLYVWLNIVKKKGGGDVGKT